MWNIQLSLIANEKAYLKNNCTCYSLSICYGYFRCWSHQFSSCSRCSCFTRIYRSSWHLFYFRYLRDNVIPLINWYRFPRHTTTTTVIHNLILCCKCWPKRPKHIKRWFGNWMAIFTTCYHQWSRDLSIFSFFFFFEKEKLTTNHKMCFRSPILILIDAKCCQGPVMISLSNVRFCVLSFRIIWAQVKFHWLD